MRELREFWNEAGNAELGNFRTVDVKEGKVTRKESTDGKNGYFTLELSDSLFCNDEMQEELTKEVSFCLQKLLSRHGYKKGKSVLVIGLGNEELTADSLGAVTVREVRVTRHLKNTSIFQRLPEVSAFKSSVSGVTGIDSFDIITGVIGVTKPDIIICVDTLASSAPGRLSKAVQITDVGISPGSGVNNAKRHLDGGSLGVPVIAIGVPLVIYAKNIVREYSDGLKKVDINDEVLSSLVVTAKDIDLVVKDFGFVLSNALNATL